MSNIDLNMAHGLAKNYIQQHYFQHLNGNRQQLMTACASYLQENGYSMATSLKVAVLEIAYCESDLCNALVDIDRSNGSLVVIYNKQNNTRHYFTVQDILNTAYAITIRHVN